MLIDGGDMKQSAESEEIDRKSTVPGHGLLTVLLSLAVLVASQWLL